jgi:hypothetical protein
MEQRGERRRPKMASNLLEFGRMHSNDDAGGIRARIVFLQMASKGVKRGKSELAVTGRNGV